MTLTQINKAGLDEIALDHVFTIGASGSSAYTFQGEGLNGTVNNPTLYLTRGKTYRFENGSGGHPIRIQSTSGASGTAYNTGVTNNAGSGTVIVEVQHDAPDVLYYQCTSHAAMNGILYITGALSDGGVTTAKLAADAVTGAKIADDSINSEHYVDGSIDAAHLATNSVTNAKIVDLDITGSKIQTNAVDSRILANDAVANANVAANAINTTEIAADAVDGTKIADDAINSEHYVDGSIDTAHIADAQITSAKLGTSAVTTGKINDQAVTAAKIADITITSGQLAASSVTTSKINDGAVTQTKIGDGSIINAKVDNAAAIAGTKIAPNFGSQNIETTGNLTCDGEFQPHWFGHQSQCAENTHNTNNYWKVAEITGAGGEGGQIVFFGTNSYSDNSGENTAARTTLIVRHTTNNNLDGIFWSETGNNTACDDIRWKYTGANNVFEIWVKKGAFNNVVPHITGSFDYAQTFGSTTGSGSFPSGSAPFKKGWSIQHDGTQVLKTEGVGYGVTFNGKRQYSASGYAALNTTYSFDVPCANDSGNGQFFYVIAGHTHYNHSYAAIRISHFCARGTSIVDTQNYANFTSGYGGSWSVTKPNNTTFRLTHNAGTYTYSGYYHVTVLTST